MTRRATTQTVAIYKSEHSLLLFLLHGIKNYTTKISLIITICDYKYQSRQIEAVTAA